jgi:histidinol-phosphate aminotransferase
VAKAVAEALPELGRYPDGGGFRLKRALSSQLGCPAEGITLGNGSNDVLDLVARVFLGPGREAVMSEFAFNVYPIVSQAVGATLRIAPAQSPDAAQPYGHDLEAMLRLVGPDTRVVFVANPNNPTGTWLTGGSLDAFLGALPEHVIVVVDEAYAEYVSTPEYPNALGWLDRHPRLVVTRTFSKVYGLASVRIGFAVSHPGVAELLNRVRQPFNVNTLAQVAALAALQDQGHVAQALALNRAGMELLTTAFEEMGLRFLPSVGNFLTIDCARPAEPVYQALLRQGVIVRPLAGYGLPHHLRISIGLSQENRRLVEALRSVL